MSGPSAAQSTAECMPPPSVEPPTVVVPGVTLIGMAVPHEPPGRISVWQVDEQPSPFITLPSSHCSPGSTALLPQTAMQPDGSSVEQSAEQPRPAGFLKPNSVQVCGPTS